MYSYVLYLVLFSCLLIASCEAGGTYHVTEIQGHRVARGILPENTVAGVKAAVALGVDTVELDAVLSGDGHVVVSHEPWMSPVICTDPSGQSISAGKVQSRNLYRMTYAEIRLYDCGSKGNPAFPEQQEISAHKPLLFDALLAAVARADSLGRQVPKFNIEIKSRPDWDGVYYDSIERYADRVYETVGAAGIVANTTLQSFDVRPLRYLNLEHPGISLALLISGEESPWEKLDSLGFDPDILSPHFSLVTPDFVARAWAKEMRVIPWTVNEQADLMAMLSLGVDGIITDYPGRALAIRDRRFGPSSR